MKNNAKILAKSLSSFARYLYDAASFSWQIQRMSQDKPIGIFDSGVGGLTVLRHIRTMLPAEDLVYVGDTAYVPYGTKSADSICKRADQIVRYLIDQHQVKAVVIACNTATSAAVQYLRNAFDIPVIGMEPGLKPAVRLSKSGTVGVLATESTLKSEKFQHLVNRFGQETRVITQHCSGLVELIEQGKQAADETRELVKHYLQPLLDQHADTVVLGCTHYPFIAPLILEISKGSVEIIETGSAIAKHLQNVLNDQQLLNDRFANGSIYFYATQYDAATRSKFNMFWGEETNLQSLDLDKPWVATSIQNELN